MAAISLSVSSVTPLGDRVLIKVSASEEKTAGGILLPDTAKEKPQVGEITAVGPGKRGDDGSRQAPDVEVGNNVLYSKYAGTDIKLGGDDYVLLSERSEEHTSELQSPVPISYAVFCLKKKILLQLISPNAVYHIFPIHKPPIHL